MLLKDHSLEQLVIHHLIETLHRRERLRNEYGCEIWVDLMV